VENKYIFYKARVNHGHQVSLDTVLDKKQKPKEPMGTLVRVQSTFYC
jgi:hypothetical protein